MRCDVEFGSCSFRLFQWIIIIIYDSFFTPFRLPQQGQQCCSGAISICSTPGNPLEVIREVPHNLDPEPDMERAVEKVKTARMKAIFRQQATGKQYVVYLETGKFDEYDSPVKSESMLAIEGGEREESIGSSVSPLSDNMSMI